MVKCVHLDLSSKLWLNLSNVFLAQIYAYSGVGKLFGGRAASLGYELSKAASFKIKRI